MSTTAMNCAVSYMIHSHELELAVQVAQLWQRDRAKHESFSINVHPYSQNHAQNCILGPPYVRIGGNVSGLFDIFNAKKLCSRVSSRECQFYS